MDKRQERREKVIKGLELCTSKIETRTQTPCETCPYHNKKYHGVLGDGCCNARSLQRDALALLKAQVEEIKALRQLVEWAEECGFGLDNILWREYVTEEELDSIDGYVEQMIYVARKAVNGNA